MVSFLGAGVGNKGMDCVRRRFCSASPVQEKRTHTKKVKPAFRHSANATTERFVFKKTTIQQKQRRGAHAAIVVVSAGGIDPHLDEMSDSLCVARRGRCDQLCASKLRDWEKEQRNRKTPHLT